MNLTTDNQKPETKNQTLVPDPATVELTDAYIGRINASNTAEGREAIWQEFDADVASGRLKMPTAA